MILLAAVTIICFNEFSIIRATAISRSPDTNNDSNGRMTSSPVESSGALYRPKRSAIYDAKHLWPSAKIPFFFADNVDSNFRENILKAMEHFHNNTCIRFIHLTEDQMNDERNYSNRIKFIKNKSTCDSQVGMQGATQTINLSDRCAGLDSLIHEMGHAIGLWHEQARTDRDAHILIKWNHMKPTFKSNFEKRKEMQWLGPYDFSSIMHYDNKMFSDFRNLNVFEPIHDHGIEIGRKTMLSFYDSLKLNKLYKCAERCNATELKCENGGYLNRFCECVCPKSVVGSRCHKTASEGVCGKIINLENQKMTLASPNHPSNYPPNIDCTWIVKAPKGHQILMTLEEYDIACNDTLEIRNHYIGNEQKPRTCIGLTKSDVRTFTSTSNRLLLNFHSDSLGEGIGFKAVMKSIRSPNCSSAPCKNKVKCKDVPDIETYFCQCEVGWAGHNCDIPMSDGHWTEWSTWSGCLAQCGQEHRQRVCKEPLNSGLDCPEGLTNESRRCGKNSIQCQGLFHCDFDSNLQSRDCGILQNILKDDFNWTLRNFIQNKERNTKGHTTGGANDTYFAMEGNDGHKWQTAGFSLPMASIATGRYCLEFFYHMSSRYVGMLRVIRQTRRTSRVLWQASGNHSVNWHLAHVNVILHDGVKVHFEGTRGDGADSDIAIDDISISPLGCYISHDGGKVLRRHPKLHKRIHGCVRDERLFRIGAPVTYNETCKQHFCYCNHNGKLDCMTKHMDRCSYKPKT